MSNWGFAIRKLEDSAKVVPVAVDGESRLKQELQREQDSHHADHHRGPDADPFREEERLVVGGALSSGEPPEDPHQDGEE